MRLCRAPGPPICFNTLGGSMRLICAMLICMLWGFIPAIPFCMFLGIPFIIPPPPLAPTIKVLNFLNSSATTHQCHTTHAKQSEAHCATDLTTKQVAMQGYCIPQLYYRWEQHTRLQTHVESDCKLTGARHMKRCFVHHSECDPVMPQMPSPVTHLRKLPCLWLEAATQGTVQAAC